MHIELDAAQLSINGVTSSVAHEEIMRRIAENLFPQVERTIKLRRAAITPRGWALATELTLRALAETSVATVTINAGKVTVSGTTDDLQAWLRAADKIEANLLAGMELITEMQEIQPVGRLQQMCVDIFQSAPRGRTIAFASNSDQIRTTAFALLDELIQIAADCPDARITVTGHTDTTGDAATNQLLGEARARAVVTYMTDRGISAARFSANGAGSTNPVHEETDGRSRRLNRRIELQLSFP